MSPLRRAFSRLTEPLAGWFNRFALIAGSVVALAAAAGVAYRSGSIALGASIGAAALFATIAAVVTGLLGGMLANSIDPESRVWGAGVLAFAAVWLAHPALLLLVPVSLAPFLALTSIGASIGVTRFFSGAVEAASRP